MDRRAAWVLSATVAVAGGCSGTDVNAPAATPVVPTAVVLAPAGPAIAAAPAVDAGVAVDAPPPDLRQEVIELGFTGDVMFGRFKGDGFQPIEAEKVDVWKYTRDLLDTDFTLVNLETPVMREQPTHSSWGARMRFATGPERAGTLVGANIDAVTLANNHAYDMRLGGVEQTPEVLDELGIRYVGAHRDAPPLFRVESFDVGGWRVGFVAATAVRNAGRHDGEPELPYADGRDLERALLPVIAAARPDHDLVIVVLHWGTEYADAPHSWQVHAARAFVDAGADAVIGHHPHVLQGVERHGDGVIAYSLGNFLFDNPNRKVIQTGVLKLRFRRDGAGHCLDGGAFHPVKIKGPQFSPRPVKGAAFRQVAGRLRKLSKARPLHRTDWTIDGGRLIVPGTCGVAADAEPDGDADADASAER